MEVAYAALRQAGCDPLRYTVSFEDMIETGGRHLRIGRLRDRVGKDCQMIFMPYIVGITKCDPIPACLPNTQIAGGIADGARSIPLEQAATRVPDGGGHAPTATPGHND